MIPCLWVLKNQCSFPTWGIASFCYRCRVSLLFNHGTLPHGAQTWRQKPHMSVMCTTLGAIIFTVDCKWCSLDLGSTQTIELYMVALLSCCCYQVIGFCCIQVSSLIQTPSKQQIQQLPHSILKYLSFTLTLFLYHAINQIKYVEDT